MSRQASAAIEAALAGLPQAPTTIAVALSAGPDSAALTCAAASLARHHAWRVLAFHIDHQLQPQSSAWADAACAIGAALGVPVHVERVVVNADGDGIEAAARVARHTALANLARAHGADAVLFGHHLDDQVETVMFRLLRGSGIDGTQGIASHAMRDGVHFLRPWLGLPRDSVRAIATDFAAAHGLVLADDPTNDDTRYARGALRTHVLPAVAHHWPAYRQTVSRFAAHAAELGALADEVAEADLKALSVRDPWLDDCLSISLWRELSTLRQRLALRAWLARAGAVMPTQARLDALCAQVLMAAQDRQPAWQHDGLMVRRHRDCLALDRAWQGPDPAEVPLTGSIDVGVVPVAAWQGALHLDASHSGIDVTWLSQGVLTLGPRRADDRMRPRAGGPQRSLRNLYQEQGVPPWLRTRLPVLRRDGVVVFAAGLGVDADAPRTADGVALRWVPDALPRQADG